MPLYDFTCETHGDFEAQCLMRDRKSMCCPQCEGPAKQIIITAPRTDVLGSEHFCDVNQVSYTSTREYEKKMAAGGWEPCGDKVGGARSEHRIRGTSFSYSNQSNRTPAAGARNG